MEVVNCEERAARSETDLKIEREWRMSLQEKEIKLKEHIHSQQMNIKQLQEDSRVDYNFLNVWIFVDIM